MMRHRIPLGIATLMLTMAGCASEPAASDGDPSASSSAGETPASPDHAAPSRATDPGLGHTTPRVVPSDADGPGWPPPKRFDYGIVVNHLGQPLEGMCIDHHEIEDDGYARWKPAAQTDAMGRYRYERLGYAARVEAYDCSPEPWWGSDDRGLATVEPGEGRGLRFVLRPGGAIEGRIVFDDGKPVAELCVAAHDGKAEDAVSDGKRAVRNAITDSQGRFRLAGLEASRRHAVSAGHCRQDTYAPIFGGSESSQRGSEFVAYQTAGGYDPNQWIEIEEGRTVTGIEYTVRRCSILERNSPPCFPVE